MRQSLLTVAMLMVVVLAWMLRDLVILVAFAGLLAYALDPLVKWIGRIPLGRRRLPRGVAAALVIVLLVLGAGAALAQAVPLLLHQFVRFATAAPGTITRLQQELRTFMDAHGWGGLLGAGPDETGSSVSSALGTIQHGWPPLLGGALGNLAGLASVVLLPLFAFYMLAGADRARSDVLGMVPAHRIPEATRFLNAVDRALRAYVRGQALVCLAMGTVVALVLRILGFPVAMLLGVAVGLGEIIPIVGFWIAATAIALVGYSKAPGLALIGVAAYAIVNSLMQTFVSPRLLGSQVKLHPFIVNVSVIGGGILVGPAGAILALPAIAIVKTLLDEFVPRRSGSGPSGSGSAAQ